MTADVDRPRVADELQLRCSQRFGHLGIGNGRHDCSGNRHCDDEDRPTSLRIFRLDVELPVEIAVAVIMNGRAMPMLVVFLMRVIRGMHVVGEALRLQRADSNGNHGGEIRTHVASVLDAP